jgi:membrane-bound lytic murein transglycosylase B
VSRARNWVRRAALSALAGGGLTGAGIGAGLPGGALAAEAPSDVPSPAPPPTSTTPAPVPAPAEATTTTTTATATPPPAGSSTAPELAPSGTGKAGKEQVGQQQAGKEKGSEPSSAGPSVVVRHKQRPTTEPSQPPAPAPAPQPATPAAPTPQTAPSADIAPAPQLAAGQVAPPVLGASLVSMQALGFYRIPLFLLPIYQAAAAQYGVPWQILAAINEVETDYGTDLAVSSAGAVGWMQFMPETWLQYGVDAVNAGYADPYNPVDAIFAAARYLKAAGAATDLHAAILAYNHSEAYVESVMLRARLIASYPSSVIATLTGLTQGSLPAAGARMVASGSSRGSSSSATAGAAPLAASPTAVSAAAGTGAGQAQVPGSVPAPAPIVSAVNAQRLADAPAASSQLTRLVSARDAPVVAVKDGRVVALGHSHKLGSYLVLRDTYGDVFTYAGLGDIAPTYRVAKPPQISVPRGALRGGEAESQATPAQAATEGQRSPLTLRVASRHAAKHPAAARRLRPAPAPSAPAAPAAPSYEGQGKVRVYAHPGNPDAVAAARAQAATTDTPPAGWARLQSGSLVAQGTVLGRVRPQGASSRYGSLRFAIRPPGDQGAIDPAPILENWRQLDAALHPQGAKAGAVLAGASADGAFLLGAGELERAVLSDPQIHMRACDRQQVAAGKADSRLLALLVFLSRSGLKPTIGELRCSGALGAGVAPRAGGALKITAFNGVSVADHQGAGTIVDVAIRTLLTAKHRFAPARIVSLMKYPGVAATVAEPDHGDYVEVVLAARHAGQARRSAGQQTSAGGRPVASVAARKPGFQLGSGQWQQLIAHIQALPRPKVSRKPSPAAIRDPKATTPGNGH